MRSVPVHWSAKHPTRPRIDGTIGTEKIGMFGLYRYALAIMVACGHLQYQFCGQVNWLGVYAVFGFYTLSGYLMTRVLHETYGYSPRGFLRYIANRALRIYPPYWTGVAFTIAMVVVVPGTVATSSSFVYFPTDAAEWVRNLSLVGMVPLLPPALVPTAWSLRVEFFYYILMGLGLSASRWLALLWFGLSAAWTVWAVHAGIDFGQRYSTILGGSLAFSAGACTYFFSRWRAQWMWIAVAAFFPHALAAAFLWTDTRTGGFYASFLLVPLCILALTGSRASARWAEWDRRLGELSYPIFLLHVQMGYLVATTWPYPIKHPFELFLLALLPLHLAGVLIDICVVRPLEGLRTRFRARNRAVGG